MSEEIKYVGHITMQNDDVPHILTEEQIVAQGWVKVDRWHYEKKAGRGDLVFTPGNHGWYASIQRKDKRSDPICLFCGLIANEDDFKQVIRLLQI